MQQVGSGELKKQRRDDLLDILGRLEHQIKSVKQKAIFVFGGVQSGKTTICNAILGMHQIEQKDQHNPYIFQSHAPSKSQNKVQSQEQSCIGVTFPKIKLIENQISLIEMPGLILQEFLFDCTWQQSLFLSFLIEKIFKKVQKVKFVLVIEENMLFLKNTHYIFKIIDNFLNIFKLEHLDKDDQRQNLLNSIQIVINHSTHKKQSNVNMLTLLAKINKNKQCSSKHNVDFLCQLLLRLCQNGRIHIIRQKEVNQKQQDLKSLGIQQNYFALTNLSLIRSVEQSKFLIKNENINSIQTYLNMKVQQQTKFIRHLIHCLEDYQKINLQQYLSEQQFALKSTSSYFRHILSDNSLKRLNSNKNKSDSQINYDLGQTILGNIQFYNSHRQFFQNQPELNYKKECVQKVEMIKKMGVKLMQILTLLCKRQTDMAKLELVGLHLERNLQLFSFLYITIGENLDYLISQFKCVNLYQVVLLQTICKQPQFEVIKQLFPKRKDVIKLYQQTQNNPEYFLYQCNRDQGLLSQLKKQVLSCIINSYDQDGQCYQLIQWIFTAIRFLINSYLKKYQEHSESCISQKKILVKQYANKISQLLIKKAYIEKYIHEQPLSVQKFGFGIQTLEFAMKILFCTRNVKMIDDYFWQVMEILGHDIHRQLQICRGYEQLNYLLGRFDKTQEILIYKLHIHQSSRNDRDIQETIDQLQSLQEIKEKSKNKQRNSIFNIRELDEGLMITIESLKQYLQALVIKSKEQHG